MTNSSVHETCSVTGKWMLSERDAGNIVRLAKRANRGKMIPKGIYVCPFCGTFHTTHFSQSNDQRRRTASRRLTAYNRCLRTPLRVYDFV